MNTREFGRDGSRVPEVGLGTWQLGSDWGPVDDARARQVLSTALDHGVTFFDTADVYGPGISEERLGRFFRGSSERPFIATKLGRHPEPGWPENFTLESMRNHTEASLRRLGAEVLDLTQLHCLPTEEYRKGAVFDNLRTLREEGMIRRFGASVESVEEALLCLEQDGLYSLQVIFNLFRQKPAIDLFRAARKKGVALIVRLPLASGLLAAKFSNRTVFPEDDHRNYNRDGEAFNVGETFAGLPFPKGLELVERLQPLVPGSLTMAQMALRWILDFDEVGVIIPGATRPGQVVSNVSTSSLPRLPRELHGELRHFYDDEVARHLRGPN
jgi:aryl-alcohol dehydrogenase-like predicted oxidoreductase